MLGRTWQVLWDASFAASMVPSPAHADKFGREFQTYCGELYGVRVPDPDMGFLGPKEAPGFRYQ